MRFFNILKFFLMKNITSLVILKHLSFVRLILYKKSFIYSIHVQTVTKIKFHNFYTIIITNGNTF